LRKGTLSQRLTLSGCAAALAIGHAVTAGAAGFAIQERGAAELGAGYAGAAAAAEDASVIADNPAGIARLTAPQVVVSGTFAVPSLPFRDAGSTLPTGGPISGGEDNGGGFILIPNLYWATPVWDGLSIGAGLFPSFGLATNYAADWIGRYNAQSSEVTSLDLAPTIAYRVLPGLSVGISPVARYTKVKFTNAIDFGSIGAGLGIPGAVPGGQDGSVKLRVNGWSFALNGGILFEPTDTTRVGLAYFHNDATTVSGSARFGRPAIGDVIAAASGAFTDSTAHSTINLPDHANFGIVQALTPDLDVRGGVTWTQWSSFKQELILFANPNQPPALMVENWRDTIGFSLGATYKVSPVLVLRGGVSYDETPVPDSLHRDLRLPDASRYGIAIGAGYRLTDSTTIDLAYQHLFGGSVGDNVVTATGDKIVGRTDLSADLVALQVTYRY
jgi:long-chain fatty acid transport protein